VADRSRITAYPKVSIRKSSKPGYAWLEKCLRWKDLWSLLGSGADDGQLPVLIKAVHIMKNEQAVMRTFPLGDIVVRLQRLDECAGLITDSLYFSVEQGKFVGSRRPRAEDWKLNSAGVPGAVSGRSQKFPNEIVKRGAGFR